VKKSEHLSGGYQAGFYAGFVSGLISGAISLLLLYNISETVRQFLFLFTIAFGCTLAIYSVLALSAGLIGGKIAQRRLARAG
jgi:hypothetical protein